MHIVRVGVKAYGTADVEEQGRLPLVLKDDVPGSGALFLNSDSEKWSMIPEEIPGSFPRIPGLRKHVTGANERDREESPW